MLPLDTLNTGAIVDFGLTCQANLYCSGKLLSVTDDEVVFMRQWYVSADEYTSVSGDRLDRTVTVDVGNPIHLDRSLIATWTFHTHPDAQMHLTQVFSQSELASLPADRINRYGEDGVCRGKSFQEELEEAMAIAFADN